MKLIISFFLEFQLHDSKLLFILLELSIFFLFRQHAEVILKFALNDDTKPMKRNPFPFKFGSDSTKSRLLVDDVN